MTKVNREQIDFAKDISKGTEINWKYLSRSQKYEEKHASVANRFFSSKPNISHCTCVFRKVLVQLHIASI